MTYEQQPQLLRKDDCMSALFFKYGQILICHVPFFDDVEFWKCLEVFEGS